MSDGIQDGGPAFPTGTQMSQNSTTGETTTHQYLSDGISIRDYFAAKAMPMMMAHFYEVQADGEVDNEMVAMRGYAHDAYMWADAMLAAREVTQTRDENNTTTDLLGAARAAEAVLARQKWREDSNDPEAVALRLLRAAIAKATGEVAK